ncbi:DUF4129 domain-containing protein [Pontibacter akesuensis]|uniref:Protein-glutamine gamma-glutamyltransferase-like C-terminal domain-containing protein n=1 Tax=Pontibacter akesuensis TaxID=388950 RepID=A0A1I7GNV0_9BACT|nr:DUF4129 domain-containing protein [Pontibacter akesuensis]GHA55789.1 hypothetical protein GCM10007389_04170 [Pontibacter akesuensis]SFU50099.1 protein of unknown function [Pontibacter akesuensis]
MRAIFRHTYTFILICLLLCTGTATRAHATDSIPAATAPVQVRSFDDDKLEEMRASEDFQYYEEVKTGETFLERLWYRIINWLREVFYKGRASGAWEYLIYALITAAIVYIVIKMQDVDVSGLFGKKAPVTDVPFEVLEENIHELNLQALLEEAVTQRDFRKAIRLHYLQSLKLLTDRGLIDWSPSKTNRSYISEINQTDIRREFELLTSMFEYVWYGGAALGDELFSAARAEFEQFNQHLKERV